MSSRFQWAILGTGNIAKQFAFGVNHSHCGALAAVGSRSTASAREFAEKFNVPRAHGSYEQTLADPGVDGVYISLPNSMHHQWTLRALAAGKHVLCEKPLATNLAQAREMFAAAEKTGRLLIEAFMYRSHPQTHAICHAISLGKIGAVRIIRTSFVYSANKIGGNVRFDHALAGGSLMDIGCYCLSLSRMLAGAEPLAMNAYGHIHESGVDDYAAGVLHFPGGIVATFACGMTVRADNTATILGTDGYIEIPVPWKPPVNDAQFTVVDAAGTRHLHTVSAGKELYALEADDFALAVGDPTQIRVSIDDSLGNQAALDELRRQIGLSF